MKYYVLILSAFMVAIVAIVYAAVVTPEVVTSDRNVPGATTGPGRTSLQE
jgi:hypothetical protein